MAELLEPIGTGIIYQDEEVRIWDLDLQPGGRTEVHQHPCDYVYVVVSGGTTDTVHADGHVDRVRDAIGDHVGHGSGIPHQLHNTGDTRYRNIIVEILNKRSERW